MCVQAVYLLLVLLVYEKIQIIVLFMASQVLINQVSTGSPLSLRPAAYS